MNTTLTSRRSRIWMMAGLLVVIAAFGAGLTRIYKQPSIEALVPKDSSALSLRSTVRSTFGLRDPLVVALIAENPNDMLTADALTAVSRATEALRQVAQIDPDQVFSIATEQWVRTEGDELRVEPLLPALPLPPDAEQQLKRALDAAPDYRGTLIAQDYSAALIAAELRDGVNPADTYEAVLEQMNALDLPQGITVHIAGEATSSGFLSRYIDRDATVLTPAAAALMLVMLGLFLHSWRGLAAGALVMLGTLATTVGLMGWLGSPLYVITSCLPAVLLCISIADVVHYGERVARLRSEGKAATEAISEALHDLYRPMLLTSMTTAAGFVGMALTAALPPLVDYGWYAAFGVTVAWIFTVVGVPLLFQLIGTPSTTVARSPRRLALSIPTRWTDFLAEYPLLVLSLVGLLTALGVSLATRVEFNEERIRNFAQDSTVFMADRALNERFAGVNFLDVYIHAEPGTSLLTPDQLARVAGLQTWMETEGGFAATHSVVDLLRNITRAINPDRAQTLPVSAEEAEQFLLLYEISGPPGDLRQEITSDRSQLHLRGHLKTANYQTNKPVVEALQAELDQRFAGSGLNAEITGSVHVTHSFFGPYLPSTLTGISASAAMVFLICALLQRSLLQGLLCIVPVGAAVLGVFGFMGALGIWLNVATSMFASIGIGLGVDFAIHTLHSIRSGLSRGHAGAALTRFVYADVGRPLAANALILALGFSITLLSSIPPLRSFGLLVAATICASYLAAILILPSLYALATRHRVAQLQPATSEGVTR
ncbi:MAG: efflux RND transporter permease subunit [Panacagrimonas sp.]